MKKTKVDHYTDKEALEFHSYKKHGKIEIVASKNMTTKRDLALAYSPGVAVPVRKISENPDAAYDYTTLPATPNMNWVMDGNTTHRPTPDVYQGNHIYEFPFIGNGIHEFYILNSGFFGSLNFQLYEITLDTSIYTYSWTTQSNHFHPFFYLFVLTH